jgi:hypothetical protein
MRNLLKSLLVGQSSTSDLDDSKLEEVQQLLMSALSWENFMNKRAPEDIKRTEFISSSAPLFIFGQGLTGVITGLDGRAGKHAHEGQRAVYLVPVGSCELPSQGNNMKSEPDIQAPVLEILLSKVWKASTPLFCVHDSNEERLDCKLTFILEVTFTRKTAADKGKPVATQWLCRTKKTFRDMKNGVALQLKDIECEDIDVTCDFLKLKRGNIVRKRNYEDTDSLDKHKLAWSMQVESRKTFEKLWRNFEGQTLKTLLGKGQEKMVARQVRLYVPCVQPTDSLRVEELLDLISAPEIFAPGSNHCTIYHCAKFIREIFLQSVQHSLKNSIPISQLQHYPFQKAFVTNRHYIQDKTLEDKTCSNIKEAIALV